MNSNVARSQNMLFIVHRNSSSDIICKQYRVEILEAQTSVTVTKV